MKKAHPDTACLPVVRNAEGANGPWGSGPAGLNIGPGRTDVLNPQKSMKGSLDLARKESYEVGELNIEI